MSPPANTFKPVCPQCKSVMNAVPMEYRGRKGKCFICKHIFRLEPPSQPPEAGPEATRPTPKAAPPNPEATRRSPVPDPEATRPAMPDPGATRPSSTPDPEATRATPASDPEATRAAQAPRAPDAAAAGAPGLLLGLYKVEKELGQGGFGAVHKVWHREWNIHLAMKTPHPQVLEAAGGPENFVREAQTWVELGLHPHIVSCYYVREVEGKPRVFAEYVPGGSLDDWIRNGTFASLETLLDTAIGFAWGLDYAHGQGLVHQDIKPANVMMASDGAPKITDFGLARAKPLGRAQQAAQGNESVLVTTGGFTPAFAAPEQLSGEKISRKADMWAYGLSLLAMFTGGVSWTVGAAAPEALESYLSREPSPGKPAMPAALADLLRQCFQHDPALRPESMDQVAETLQSIFEQAVGRPFSKQKPEAGAGTPDSLNNHALSLLDMGLTEQAVQAWDKAHVLDPHHIETHYNYLLYSSRSMGLFDDDVVLRIDELRQSHTESDRDEYFAGKLNLLCHEYEKAVTLLRQAAPKVEEAEAYRDLGLALLAQCRVQLEPLGDERALTDPEFKKQYLASSAEAEACFRRYLKSGHPDWESATGLAKAVDNQNPGQGKGEEFYSKLAKKLSGPALPFAQAVHRYLPAHESVMDCSILYDTQDKVAVSHDGRYVAGAYENQVRLFDTLANKREDQLKPHTFPHSEDITRLVFSPDNTTLFVGNEYGHLTWWDADKKEPLRFLQAHPTAITDILPTPDGAAVLTLGRDQRDMILWSTATGGEIRRFRSRGEPFTRAAMAGNGSVLLAQAARVGEKDNAELTVFDMAGGAPLKTLPYTADTWGVEWNKLTVSPDGRFASAVMYIKEFIPMTCVWDLNAGRIFVAIQGPAAFHPDGKTMAMQDFSEQTQSMGNPILLVDMNTGEHQAIQHKTLALGMAFSSDGGRLAYWFQAFEGVPFKTDSVFLVDMRTRQHVKTMDHAKFNHPPVKMKKPLRAQPLATGLLALIGDSAVSILDPLNTYTPSGALARPKSSEEVSALAREYNTLLDRARSSLDSGQTGQALQLARQARSLEGFERDRKGLEIWNDLRRTCRLSGLRTLWMNHAWKVHEPAPPDAFHLHANFHADITPLGNVLAVCSGEEKISLWDAMTGTPIRTAGVAPARYRRVRFSGCGRYLAAATLNHELHVFDLQDDRLRLTLPAQGAIAGLGAQPGSYGRELYVAMEHGDVIVINMEAGTVVRTFSKVMDQLSGLEVSHKGDLLYLIGLPRFVAVDAKTGEIRHAMGKTPAPINKAIPTMAGDCLIAMALAGERKLFQWLPEQGKAKPRFILDPTHLNRTFDAVNPDGRFALTGGKGVIRLQDADSPNASLEYGLVENFDTYFTAFLPGGTYGLSIGTDGMARLLHIDWKLEHRESTPWDESARPFLERTLALCSQVPPPEGTSLDELDLVFIPAKEFEALMHTLRTTGLGWIEEQGVRAELEKMAEVKFLDPEAEIPVPAPPSPTAAAPGAPAEAGADAQAEADANAIFGALRDDFMRDLGKIMMDAIVSPDQEAKESKIILPERKPGPAPAYKPFCPYCDKPTPGEAQCEECGNERSLFLPNMELRNVAKEVMRKAPNPFAPGIFANKQVVARDFNLAKAISLGLVQMAELIEQTTDPDKMLGVAMSVLYSCRIMPTLHFDILSSDINRTLEKGWRIAHFLLPDPHAMTALLPMAQTLKGDSAALRAAWNEPQKDFPQYAVRNDKLMRHFTAAPDIFNQIAEAMSSAVDNRAACVHLGNMLYALTTYLSDSTFRNFYIASYQNTAGGILEKLMQINNMGLALTRFKPNRQRGDEGLAPLLPEQGGQASGGQPAARVDLVAKPADSPKRKQAAQATSVEQIVQLYANDIRGPLVSIAPSIPAKKAINAKNKYARTMPGETPLVLLDNTVFGSGKEGLLLTDTMVYVKEMGCDPQSFAYGSLRTAAFTPNVLSLSLEFNGKKVHGNLNKTLKNPDLFAEMILAIGDYFRAKESPAGEAAPTPAPAVQAPGADAPAPSGEDMQDERQKYLAQYPELASALESYRTMFPLRTVHLSPKFPAKILQGARKNFAPLELNEQPIVLVDSTSNRSGTQGLLLSDRRLYAREGTNKEVVSINDISAVSFKHGALGGRLEMNGRELPFGCPLDKQGGIGLAEMLNELIPLIEPPKGFSGPREVGDVEVIAARLCPEILPARLFRENDLTPKKYTRVHDRLLGKQDLPLALYLDTSVLGSAKVGVALTPQSIFIRDQLTSAPVEYPLNTINSIDLKKGAINSSLVINGDVILTGITFDLVPGAELLITVVTTALGL